MSDTVSGLACRNTGDRVAPTRLTLQFERKRMKHWPGEMYDELARWLSQFGLKAAWMPSDAPIVFDTKAKKILTQYVVAAPGSDPDAESPAAVLGDGGPLTETVEIDFEGELPQLPDRFRSALAGPRDQDLADRNARDRVAAATADEVEAGQAMYAAYTSPDGAGDMTWDGRPMPRWEEMGPRQQAGWIETGREGRARG